MLLKIRTTSDLENLALKRGWIENPAEKRAVLLPKIPIYSFNFQENFLEKEFVTAKSPSTINIKEPVIVAGSNFGLIYKDYFFPFGFSHSPNWLGINYQMVKKDLVNFSISNANKLNMTGSGVSLLGTTNHWGHFFVDAMDRLNALLNHDKKILITDKNFFGFNAKVDEYGIVPQSTEIIKALGYTLSINNLVPVSANNYYYIDDLEAIGLLSEKPAISAETFVRVRSHLMKSFQELGSGDSSRKRFLYVGRSGQAKRTVKDEQDLEIIVKNNGGEVVKLGEEPLHQVVKTFSNVGVVIIVIGSAKFNLIFCKPGTKVLLVVPVGYRSGVLTMVRHICVALELDLSVYEVPILSGSNFLLNSNLLISPANFNHMLQILFKS